MLLLVSVQLVTIVHCFVSVILYYPASGKKSGVL